MPSSFSARSSSHDQTSTSDEIRPVRAGHHRSQKPFDLNDAQTLKNDIEQSFTNAVGKLSIFDRPDETTESVQLLAHRLQPERPITPPDKEITLENIPHNVEQLLTLVRRRLIIRRPPTDNSRLTFDDLSQLATIILTQIRSKWIDIEEMNVRHPLLTLKQNHELIRRLFVNIVSICASIFEHTVREAHIFHDRYVFSHPANMTRLRTLLADQINTLVNIHSLREHLASEMIEEDRLKKGLIVEETNLESPRQRPSRAAVLGQHRPGVRDLVELAGKSYKYHLVDPTYDSKYILNQVMTNMPDITRLRRPPIILPPVRRTMESSVPKKSTDHPKLTSSKFILSSAVDKSALRKQQEKNDVLRVLRRTRYGSLPNLHEQFLSEELDCNLRAVKQLKVKTTDNLREHYSIDEERQKRELASAKPISNRTDLLQLTTQQPIEQETTDDIPPLIKVLTSAPNTKQRIDEHKQTILAVAKRRKAYLDEIKETTRDEPICPQPSSVEKTFQNMTFRISDIAISNSCYESAFLLTNFAMIFNNYFGEIDDDTVAYLDRNLYIGQQIKQVYQELLSTIDVDFCFRLDTDKYVVKCPDQLNLSIAQASSTLSKPLAGQINNPSLVRQDRAPWSDTGLNRERWILTPDPRKIEADAQAAKKRGKKKTRGKGLVEPVVNMSLVPDPQLIASYKPRDSRQTRDFQLWQDYWSHVHSIDDYMKYLSTQSTDYLHHIFHLHEPLSEDHGLDPDDQAILDERNRALKERENRISQLKDRKTKFEQGVWNAESVFLGGLGRDPALPPIDDPLIQFEQNQENKKPKSKRINLFDPNATRKALSSKRLLTTILANIKASDVQKRLEHIWKLLRMTDNDRLHMAVKYSTIEYEKKLESALNAWDTITDLIVRREKFLGDLEIFERTASDANRFFESGPMGSSKMRMSESRRRTYLYNQLAILEKQILNQWNQIKTEFGDTVTFNGRNYLDKMQFDKLEMLHYLQEERRLNYLHSYATMIKHNELNSSFTHVL